MKTQICKLSFKPTFAMAILAIVVLILNQDLFAQTCSEKVKSNDPTADLKLEKFTKSAIAGNLETIKILVEEKGVDVNQTLKNNQTALLLSSYNGHAESVKYLLGKGADASIKNKWGNAALHDAAMQGHSEIAQMLIKKGADVNITGQYGNTPLHYACNREHPNVAKVLIENGADVAAKDEFQNMPITLASWRGSAEIMKLLVENGADVNSTTSDKYSVLHILAIRGYDDITSYMLSKGADANMKDELDRLPIHNAIINGHPKIAEILIPKTKNINSKEKTLGNTPLHIAAINGDKLVSEKLLAAGAKPNIENNANKKPIDYAVKYGFTDLTELYIEKDLASNKALKVAEENRKLNESKIDNGEAQVIYCGHSGWIVNTQNKVLVFDYWSMGNKNQPSLANGQFCSDEMKDKEVYVFASHDHNDHYDPIIHTWKEKVKNITYIYGFDPNQSWVHKKDGYNGPKYIHIPDNDEYNMSDNFKITTIKSNDTGQGFLVEVDGISVFHPGDHAWFATEDEKIFKKEMNFISEKNNHVDIAFLPVTGCPSRWEKENIVAGFFYSIDKLNPKQVYPMHAFQREYSLKEFAELAEQKKSTTDILCAENKGDHYMFNEKSMAKK